MQRTLEGVVTALGTGFLIATLSVGHVEANQRMPPEKRIVMKSQEIPSSVLGRLKELREEAKREGYIYVGVDYCVRGNQKVFQVLSGTGFAGLEQYYSESGKHLGNYATTDYHIVGSPVRKQPVDIGRFDCKEIQIVDAQ